MKPQHPVSPDTSAYVEYRESPQFVKQMTTFFLRGPKGVVIRCHPLPLHYTKLELPVVFAFISYSSLIHILVNSSPVKSHSTYSFLLPEDAGGNKNIVPYLLPLSYVALANSDTNCPNPALQYIMVLSSEARTLIPWDLDGTCYMHATLTNPS